MEVTGEATNTELTEGLQRLQESPLTKVLEEYRSRFNNNQTEDGEADELQHNSE